MSDPKRLLLSDQASDFERSLLKSWEAEAPSDNARAKTLAILGLGTGAAIAATATTATAATAGVASTAPAATAAAGSIAPKAIGGVLLLKWWGIGAVTVGAASVGVGAYVATHHEPAPVVLATQNTVQNRPVSTPAPTHNEVAPPPVTQEKIAPPHPTAHASKATSTTLADEVADLDRARAAQSAGDNTRAIAIVDEYEAHHPKGALVQEAEVVRIQALLARGDRAAAQRTADKFFAAYPSSPHAARVRSLLNP